MSVRQVQVPEAYEGLYVPHRYKVFWGGRGSGKSTSIADAILTKSDQQPLRILCAREIQKSIKESVHELLRQRAVANNFPHTPMNTEIRHPNGSQIIFEGLWRNIDSIKSLEAIDILWVEEAHSVSEESWSKLIPTIRKPGSEIWASFNPELKSDPVYRRFIIGPPPPDSLVVKTSWRDNPWISKELLSEMQYLRETDYEKYLHVWEGELMKYADGAVYAKQLQQAYKDGRVRTLPIQKAEECNTFWDLGKSDSTAIWVHQRVGPDDRFIDYLEFTGADIDEIAKALINRSRERGYLLGRAYMPHDVTHDILGFGNRTRKQMFESAGIKPITVVPRVNSIQEGIEMVRARFASYWFDERYCERGLECLASYAYERSDRLMDLKPEPMHNWASHGADALRQHAQGYRRGIGFDSPSVERRYPASVKTKATPHHIV